MTFPTQNRELLGDATSGVDSGEETLRLIANLPAPQQLVERVKAGLRTAPRSARVLGWPAPLLPGQGWIRSSAARSAAAAAIVMIVAGGSWGVYSRVQPAPSPNVLVPPLRVAPSSGFSSAGAVRTPQTLNGSLMAHPGTGVLQQTNNAPKAAVPAASKLRQGKKMDKGIRR